MCNALLFHGEKTILPCHIEPWDCNLSTMMKDRSGADRSLSRERDLIKKVMINDTEVIIAFEIQQEKDATMTVRVMGYDYMSYLIQLQNDKTKIIPVFTIVLYFGEGQWQYAKELEEMSEKIPEELKEKFNNYRIIFVDVKEIDVNNIDDEKTRKIIDAVQRLYKFKNPETLKNLNLTKSMMLAAGKLTNTEEVIKMSEMMDEGGNDMCSAFSEYVQKERNQAIDKGREEGRIQSQEDIARRMILTGRYSLEDISLITELEVSRIKDLQFV